MACSKERQTLIQQVIDGEASEQDVHELKTHMQTCLVCREMYSGLEDLEKQLHVLPLPEVSVDFTNRVIQNLRTSAVPLKRTDWLRRHPALFSAACFVVLMLGFVFSLNSNHSFQAEVLKGNGQLTYSGGHTVIVPKNEVIKGDLVVKNGNVKINGKVEGNVILINSHSMMASAGQVTGKIEKVNRIVGEIWYTIKSIFTGDFFQR
jgi:anti-sigma factor RsiW